jgi:hypothetical protein
MKNMKEKEILKGILLLTFASFVLLMTICMMIAILGFTYLATNHHVILGVFFLCSIIFMLYQLTKSVTEFNKILK